MNRDCFFGCLLFHRDSVGPRLCCFHARERTATHTPQGFGGFVCSQKRNPQQRKGRTSGRSAHRRGGGELRSLRTFLRSATCKVFPLPVMSWWSSTTHPFVFLSLPPQDRCRRALWRVLRFFAWERKRCIATRSVRHRSATALGTDGRCCDVSSIIYITILPTGKYTHTQQGTRYLARSRAVGGAVYLLIFLEAPPSPFWIVLDHIFSLSNGTNNIEVFCPKRRQRPRIKNTFSCWDHPLQGCIWPLSHGPLVLWREKEMEEGKEKITAVRAMNHHDWP
jgi:hypothetical protein